MLKRRGGPDLRQETLGADDRGQFRAEDLDRHLAVALEVLGQVDRSQAAGAEFTLDPVPVGQRGSKTFEGHGRAPDNCRTSAGRFCTTAIRVISYPCTKTKCRPSGVTSKLLCG